MQTVHDTFPHELRFPLDTIRQDAPRLGLRPCFCAPIGLKILCPPAAQFRRAAAAVERSLTLADGRARVVTRRPNDDALFFASREHFWIGHLCNHWTAGVLNAAGFAVRPLRSVTSAEVMAAVDRAEVDSPPSRD